MSKTEQRNVSITSFNSHYIKKQDYFHASWQQPCQIFQRLLTFIIIHNFLFLQIILLLLQDYQTDRLQLSSENWKDRKQKCFKSNSGAGLTHLSTPQWRTKHKNILLKGEFLVLGYGGGKHQACQLSISFTLSSTVLHTQLLSSFISVCSRPDCLVYNIWRDSPPSHIQLHFYSLRNFNQKFSLNLKCPAVLNLSPLTIIDINHTKLIASKDKAKAFFSFSPIWAATCAIMPCSGYYPLLMTAFASTFKKMATDFNHTWEKISFQPRNYGWDCQWNTTNISWMSGHSWTAQGEWLQKRWWSLFLSGSGSARGFPGQGGLFCQQLRPWSCTELLAQHSLFSLSQVWRVEVPKM